MEVLEKSTTHEFWITLIFVLLFILVFLLRHADAKLLKQHVGVIYKVPFVSLETEDSIGMFNLYQILLFLFSVLVFSLLTTLCFASSKEGLHVNFTDFTYFFGVTFLFFTIKWFLEYLLSILFLIKKQIKLFIISKWNYLFSLSFYIYIALILSVYSKIKFNYILFFTLFLFTIRFVFILITNKKLIFRKLFYFILYLCALEIAPLFILFKLVF